jgi:hypothetical protein
MDVPEEATFFGSMKIQIRTFAAVFVEVGLDRRIT